MTEGQGRTAASVPGGADASDAAVPAAQPTPPVTGAPSPTGVAPPAGATPGPAAAGARAAAAKSATAAGAAAGGAARPGEAAAAEGGAHRRVDARRLESALLEVRRAILGAPIFLEAPGVEAARAERLKLLSQIDDYLLPRLRESGSPILVALVGSTGAGKSTLVNSLVGKQVSNTGIRRPTTNSPVLASHPSETDWFAENVFLPTLPRVRQQGLAMPGRDGLLVLASSEGMPKGVALLDTPDIDSVVQAHREFAHQFLDASDLWLFMTTSTRYADAAVWELLQYATGPGRLPGDRALAGAASLRRRAHRSFRRDARGQRARRCPPLRHRGDGADRGQAPGRGLRPDPGMAGRHGRPRGPASRGSHPDDVRRARHLPDQAARPGRRGRGTADLRAELRAAVDEAYAAGLAEIDEATRNGSLLRGEILARWQDFTGTGDLLRMLQVRRGGAAAASRPRNRRIPARASALKAALRHRPGVAGRVGR